MSGIQKRAKTSPVTARDLWQPAAITAACLLHFVVIWSAASGLSATVDEGLHIAAGVSYWQRNDYRLQPENGNLPQRWLALPLLLSDRNYPAPNFPAWLAGEAPAVGREYLYRSGNDPGRILAAARFMAAAWSTGICLLVFLWSRSLFGAGGGWLSLGLAASWPALLAHGPLATSDACGGLFLSLAVWTIWKLLQRITPGSLAAACLATGLAFTAKHSAILLVPIAGILACVTCGLGPPVEVAIGGWRRRHERPLAKAAAAVAAGLVVAVAVVACIWGSVGFRYEAANPAFPCAGLGQYRSLDLASRQAGTVGGICRSLGERRLLPEAWLYGLCHVLIGAKLRNAFALGLYSHRGWWWYFPLCLAIKNTLPGLVLAAAGLVSWCREAIRRSRIAYECTPLVVMLVVLWTTFLTSHLNIGERHLIPAYPPLLILAGGLWRLATTRAWRAVVAGLAILHAADSLGRYPVLFPYFNQLVPSDRAHWWLVDSNLDWGQGLAKLDRWLAAHTDESEPVYLAYFGGALPEHVIPRATMLGKAPAPGTPQRFAPGVYCVSATALQAVWLDLAGRWCEQFETHYLGLRDRLGAHEAAGGPPLTPGQAAAFNSLQRARLLAFLRHRPPDAIVDLAFLVFRLDAADLAAALEGPPAELDAIAWADTEPVLVARGRVRRGVQLWEEGDRIAATAEFREAAALDSLNADAWAGLARGLAAEGDRGAAAEALRRVEALGGPPAVTVPALLDFSSGPQPGGPP
jgi:hypothetical protein